MTVIAAMADVAVITITVVTAVITNHSLMWLTWGRLIILATVIAEIVRVIIRGWPNYWMERKYCIHE